MKTKTTHEIAVLAEAGRILHDILMQLVERTIPGASGIELSRMAEDLIREAGGVPAFKGYGKPPYPAALCVSINDCVVHGIPSEYRFKKGDLIGLDIGMIYQNLYTDMARSVALLPVTSREQELMNVTQKALDLAIEMVRPGITTGDIGHCVQSYVEKRGFGVVRDLAGHGVGYALHEPPDVPNFGKRGTGDVLVPGMVLALEPMITLGDWRVTMAEDNWSIKTVDGSKTAHFEDMVAVTESGHRVLTRP